MSLGFEINAEQQELKQEVAELAHKLRPRVDYWERKSVAPRELFREMGRRRWMGPIVPREYGGMGKGTIEYSIISEELARAGLFGPQAHHSGGEASPGLGDRGAEGMLSLQTGSGAVDSCHRHLRAQCRLQL